MSSHSTADHSDQPPQPATGTGAEEGQGEDEKMCRYCFGGEDEGALISPCDCRGGQRYVHLSCLRRWQRMVLVSQPTHPALQSATEDRHHCCNVCRAPYTCAPPTRGDLMASFTGPEIAALIAEGCIIASRDSFSEYLEATRRSTVFFPRSSSHWIRGVYLITSVTADTEEQTLPITDQSFLDQLRNQLDDNLEFTVHGRALRLTSGGSLLGVPAENRAAALAALRAPAELVFASVTAPSFSDDHIAAVNLTNPVPPPAGARESNVVSRALEQACTRFPGASRVEITHFNGGPCVPREIMACVVLGGGGRGWTVKKSLCDAILLAHTRGARRFPGQGDIGGGQTMKIVNLRARTDLNEKRCLVLRFDEPSGRWAVIVGDTGESVRIKPDNLAPVCDDQLPGAAAESVGSHGRVLVFWGNAGWSRAQLLGEIAHGSWGLCRATASDFTTDFHQRWAALSAPGVNRLAFAPISEMTEDYVTTPSAAAESRASQVNQQLEMEGLRGITTMLAGAYGQEDSEDDMAEESSATGAGSEGSDIGEPEVSSNSDNDSVHGENNEG